MKTYSYNKALRQQSKHQIIVPHIDKSAIGNLADLVRLAFMLPPHRYILLDEQTVCANVIKLAQNYNEDAQEVLNFYSQKETEYLSKNFHSKGINSITATRDCKQYALNATYEHLKNKPYIKL